VGCGSLKLLAFSRPQGHHGRTHEDLDLGEAEVAASGRGGVLAGIQSRGLAI
jgi:hypothetical protein